MAGDHVDRRDAVRTREPPGDRVLAAAAAEHEAVRTGRAGRAAGAPVGALLADDLLDLLALVEQALEPLHRREITLTVTPIRSWPAASKRCRKRRGSLR